MSSKIIKELSASFSNNVKYNTYKHIMLKFLKITWKVL